MTLRPLHINRACSNGLIAPLFDGYIRPLFRAVVYLPRPMDATVGAEVDLPPMGDPSGHPAHGEHNGKHVDRDTDSPQDNLLSE